MKYAYLIYVDELENHNKFYEISEGDNGIDVTYGRVGSNGIKKHYDRYATSFERLRESKIEKGYEDRTALHSKVISDEEKYTDYKAIEDGVVDEVISFLYQSSKNFMKNNYTVKPNEITEK